MTARAAPATRPLRAAPVAAPPRMRGLDGVRAIAVAAVVAYHLDERVVPGGFLGVDVFFVLSGYLITGLLLEDWEGDGSIGLGAFWQRRARRLVPPLAMVLVAVAVLTPSVFADVAGRVQGELVAAVFQGANWFEALAGHSYFDGIGRPSPLRHLWSLGVEAQFYALWPLVAVVALRRGGRRTLGAAAAIGAVTSFAAMALAFHAGHDPSRLYYGTDTRAGTLLVGAVLAVFWRDCRVPDAAGAAALVGLGALVLRLDGTSAVAYRGGLLAVAVLAAVVVAAAAGSGGVSRLLGTGPLVWLGTRSYAVYLWHWPVLSATRPGIDVEMHGWTLLALRLGVTLALAEATTRLVLVMPRWPSVLERRGRLAWAIGASLLVATTVAVVRAPSSSPAFAISPTTTVAARATTTTARRPSATTTLASVTTVAPRPTPTTVPPPPPAPIRAVAVGESVLLAAGGDVQRALGPGTVVDAAVGRQPNQVLDALDAERQAGHLDGVTTIVVQMGTNGEVRGKQIDRLAALVGSGHRVVAVTVWVDRPWGEPSNAALRQAATRYPWLRLADWHELASHHPEWLGHDGVHPNREGARQYATLVAGACRAR